MKKRNLNFLIIALTMLIILNLASANNYGANVYGTGLYGSGYVTPTPPSSSSSSSSSGGGGGGGSSCTDDWECTDWFPNECPASGIQERICINRGTCTGTASMPKTTHNCTYKHEEPLFDIFLTLSEKSKELCAGDKIKTNIRLENYGKIELLDAFMTYWIVDENNSLIAELKDTRAVTNEKDFEVELKINKQVNPGTYKIYAQINYNQNATALAGETFEILSQEECKLISQPTNLFYPIIGLSIVILIIALLFITEKLIEKIKSEKKDKHAVKHKKYKAKVKNKLEKIKKGKYWIIAIGIIITGIFIANKSSITGNAVKETIEIINLGRIFALLFVSSSIGLMLMLYKKYKWKFRVKNTQDIPKNQLESLIKRKVYTEEGEYIGTIEDIHLKENKIDYFQIKLNKERFNFKGIIIKYREVESVGDIILIRESLVEILKNKKV